MMTVHYAKGLYAPPICDHERYGAACTSDPAGPITCQACIDCLAAGTVSALCKHLNAVAISGTYDEYECPDCKSTVKARYFDERHSAFLQQLGEDD